ncbi:MAG: DNA-binding response regulator [Chloroflexi bacterium HGW-Chloroflexi-6]|nr:MAG: DNA-binding response regulator [Chloroflexi bacterium HGW-Chloroflexi-6]
MDKIRVLVVDDQNVVREGLVAILSFQSDIEVVGQASDGLQATQMLPQTKPDVVLLDLVMPIQDGLTTIPQIKQLMPDVQILVLSGFAEGDLIFSAIKAGAIGYMLKDATRDQLFQAIRDVSHGLASLHPSIALRVIREINNSPQPAPAPATASHILTPRELETLRLIGRGHSNQEIAAILVVNDRTVAKYVSSILSKLHLSNRTQAALYAVREGLMDDSEPKDSTSSGSPTSPVQPDGHKP